MVHLFYLVMKFMHTIALYVVQKRVAWLEFNPVSSTRSQVWAPGLIWARKTSRVILKSSIPPFLKSLSSCVASCWTAWLLWFGKLLVFSYPWWRGFSTFVSDFLETLFFWKVGFTQRAEAKCLNTRLRAWMLFTTGAWMLDRRDFSPCWSHLEYHVNCP